MTRRTVRQAMWATGGLALAQLGACNSGAPTVALALDSGGRGDLSFNDMAAAGFDRAVEEFDLTSVEVALGDGDPTALVQGLCDDRAALVVTVGFAFADAAAAVAATCPASTFVTLDVAASELPNVRGVVFAQAEGSFLVGAAAALTSEAGRVGFIGGVDMPLIREFEAGFAAGVAAIDTAIPVDVEYLSMDGDFSGFNDPALAQDVATGMYETGADVIFHASGASGAGLFVAAAERRAASSEVVWAIGVDSDQYLIAPTEVRDVVLTSMLKRLDTAAYDAIKGEVNGESLGGQVTILGLADDGVGYSTSGDFLDAPTITRLEELREQVIDGTIDVPTVP